MTLLIQDDMSLSIQQQNDDSQDVIMTDPPNKHEELAQQQAQLQTSGLQLYHATQRSWAESRVKVFRSRGKQLHQALRAANKRALSARKVSLKKQRRLWKRLGSAKVRVAQLEAGAEEACSAAFENSQLRTEVAQNFRIVSYQAEELFQLQAKLNETVEENATLKREASNHAQTLSDFFTAANNSQQAAQHKDVQIQILQNQLQTAEAQLVQARSRTLAVRGKRIANANKVSDAFLQQEWKKLGYNIRGVAHMLSKTKLDAVLNSTIGKQLAGFTRKSPKMLGDAESMFWMLQHAVWTAVYQNYLVPNSQSVPRGRISLLSELKHNLADCIRDANDDQAQKLGQWFADGSDLTSKTVASHDTNESAEVLAAGFMNNLVICFPSIKEDLKLRENVSTDLAMIFNAAEELGRLFLFSRAFFQFGFGRMLDHDGQTYLYNNVLDIEHMDDPSDGNKRITQSISPWCVKRGNADGHDYDQQIVLAKGQALHIRPHATKVSQNRP